MVLEIHVEMCQLSYWILFLFLPDEINLSSYLKGSSLLILEVGKFNLSCKPIRGYQNAHMWDCGERVQLTGGILTVCVEISVPCWLYTKHKFLVVPNGTTSSVDYVANAFVWIIIPRRRAFKISSLYRERESMLCMCVCVRERERKEERDWLLANSVLWDAEAHMPPVIKEHNLKVATLSNYMKYSVCCCLSTHCLK